MEITNDNDNDNASSSEMRVDHDNSNDCVMINNIVDFQIANDMSVLLKNWHDSDYEEGMSWPLSSLMAKEKHI